MVLHSETDKILNRTGSFPAGILPANGPEALPQQIMEIYGREQ